jgi:hypothetical protein
MEATLKISAQSEQLLGLSVKGENLSLLSFEIRQYLVCQFFLLH